MNYKKVYDQIIENAKKDSENRKGIYTETHHIIPKCAGGGDEKENLVKLTAREHFICHWLLWKEFKELKNDLSTKLGFAFVSFQRKSEFQSGRKINSHQYEIIKHVNIECGRYSNSGKKNPMYGKPCFYKMTEEEKERWKNNISKSQSGEKNGFYGKKHSDETKEKLRQFRLGKSFWYKVSDDAKNKFYTMIHAKKTEEHKLKIGRKGLINLRNKKTGEIIRVPKTDERYNSDEWEFQNKGIKLKKESVCPYCGIITDNAHFVRWHGENCKKNPKRNLNENC